MNETEKARVAAATNALRPDWPTASVRTLLDRPELTNRARRDVACALAWVACETESKVPARVLENGPWWTAWRDATVVRHPPKAHEQCGTHPGEYRLSCRCCAADKRAVRDEADAAATEQSQQTRAEIIAKARADIAAARAAVRASRPTLDDEQEAGRG